MRDDQRNDDMNFVMYNSIFAQNDSGEASAFIEGADPYSVFNRIEYPMLLQNPKITNIVYSPDITLFNGLNP